MKIGNQTIMNFNLHFLVEKRVFIRVYQVTLSHQSLLKLGIATLVLGVTTWLTGVVFVAVGHQVSLWASDIAIAIIGLADAKCLREGEPTAKGWPGVSRGVPADLSGLEFFDLSFSWTSTGLVFF